MTHSWSQDQDLMTDIRERARCERPDWKSFRSARPGLSESMLYRLLKRSEQEARIEKAAFFADPVASAHRRRDPIQIWLDLDVWQMTLDLSREVEAFRLACTAENEPYSFYWANQAISQASKFVTLPHKVTRGLRNCRSDYLDGEQKLLDLVLVKDRNYRHKMPYRRAAVVGAERHRSLILLCQWIGRVERASDNDDATRPGWLSLIKSKTDIIVELMKWGRSVFTARTLESLQQLMISDIEASFQAI